jgi:hypothetical protein
MAIPKRRAAEEARAWGCATSLPGHKGRRGGIGASKDARVPPPGRRSPVGGLPSGGFERWVRALEMGAGSVGNARCARMATTTAGSLMSAMIGRRAPQGHARTSAR